MSLPDRVLQTRPDVGPLVDPFGREHTYLRLSVTDRCNFRCTYCMPAEGLTWLPKDHLLSFEEIGRVVGVFASMGIRRVRLTGGEPTIRRDLVDLVRVVAAQVDELAMTTNGHRFAKHAQALADAGLDRVNISIDSLDAGQFAELTRGGDLGRVLAAIEAARAAGLTPIKLNAVVLAGVNDDQVQRMIAHFAPHAADTIVRFIEYMPFGANRRLHLPSRVLRERLAKRYTLVPVETVGVGPARSYRIEETGQRIGFISPITEHFCDQCNRLRLQADGNLRTCLSRDDAPNLRDVLRSGADDAELERTIRAQVWGKVAGHEAHLDGDFRAFEGIMTAIGG